MRLGGGKAKGAQFERDCCRDLSLWVSSGDKEDLFWRSAMSGGRSTVAFDKGKRLAAQAGDISCIHSTGETLTRLFLIECKFYRELDHKLAFQGRGRLIQFWRETCSDAAKYGKRPFLIAKQNRWPAQICLDSQGLSWFGRAEPIAHFMADDMFVLDYVKFLNGVPPIK